MLMAVFIVGAVFVFGATAMANNEKWTLMTVLMGVLGVCMVVAAAKKAGIGV